MCLCACLNDSLASAEVSHYGVLMELMTMLTGDVPWFGGEDGLHLSNPFHGQVAMRFCEINFISSD